ncbi:MAG: 2-dehydropantoate 2-reductase N-terminal domain-containing protein [Candidatus Hydrogenedentota bacterium]
MRFAVIGAGAVGCYYGGRLAQHGEEVHYLCRSDYDVMKEKGLKVESCDGDFHVDVHAYRNVRDMPQSDVVIVSLKGFDTPALRDLLPPLLLSTSLIVTLQNGLGNEEAIASVCGPERVIAGSAFICSEKVRPGVVLHTSAGTMRLAWFDSSAVHPGAGVEDIAARFKAAGVKCSVEPDDQPDGAGLPGRSAAGAKDGAGAAAKKIKWLKLVWNVPFSGLSIYFGGVTTDVIMNDPDKRAFARGLMEEVIAAARADGVTLDSSMVEANFAATEKMGAYRPSMLVDFLSGRPLETEQIFAEPLRRGEAGGASLPLMRKLLSGVPR